MRLLGLGSDLYLIAHPGAGPREGLMTGLQRLTALPIAWVRMAIEICELILGCLPGGMVGIGAVVVALGIGPSLSALLYRPFGFPGAVSARIACRCQE